MCTLFCWYLPVTSVASPFPFFSSLSLRSASLLPYRSTNIPNPYPTSNKLVRWIIIIGLRSWGMLYQFQVSREKQTECVAASSFVDHDGIKNTTFEIVSILVSLNNYRQLPTQSPAGFSQYLVRWSELLNITDGLFIVYRSSNTNLALENGVATLRPRHFGGAAVAVEFISAASCMHARCSLGNSDDIYNSSSPPESNLNISTSTCLFFWSQPEPILLLPETLFFTRPTFLSESLLKPNLYVSLCSAYF